MTRDIGGTDRRSRSARRFVDRPIAEKLRWITAGLCSAAILTVSSLAVFLDYRSCTSQIVQGLRTSGALVARNAAASLVSGDREAATRILGSLREDGHVRAAHCNRPRDGRNPGPARFSAGCVSKARRRRPFPHPWVAPMRTRGLRPAGLASDRSWP